MAKHNGIAQILPFKRKKTLIEKCALAVLAINLIQLSIFCWFAFIHSH
jgi:hypothetical protein